MVVYWDAVALLNVVIDYLLLYVAARLCGWRALRFRLGMAAIVGGAGAVLFFLLPEPWLLYGVIPLLMCAAAYSGSGKALRLSVLFLLSSCTLGGLVLLLGRMLGESGRLSRAVFAAELPWEVFFLAGVLTYVLLGIVFHATARRVRGDYVTAKIVCGAKTVHLRLLRDTGNQLTDPRTGLGVPVVERQALTPLDLPAEREILFYHALGTTAGELEAFRCDEFVLEGQMLGERLIAIAPIVFRDCCGLWCEGGEQHVEN